MRWLVLFWLSFLSGCVLLQPPPAMVARPARFETAPFAMNGRISVDHLGERHSSGLHWTHREQSDEILLLTPLGQTAARVFRDSNHATLDEGDKHYQDTDAESLMEQVLGWHLPLNALHLWVMGMPDNDGDAQIERDKTGRISKLHQSGWNVNYLRYADTGLESMPARLLLNHDEMQVQLLIDEWEWNPE
jgi:outer membrane lipoprotein LolB